MNDKNFSNALAIDGGTMFRIKKLCLNTLIFSVCLGLSASLLASEYKIIHAGTLLLDARDKPLNTQSVIVKDSAILEIKSGYSEKSDINITDGDTVSVIDLSENFVMAGLIDAHVHITGDSDRRDSRLDIIYKSEAERALLAVPNARNKLLAGYTTIRNVGGDRNIVVGLRDGIKSGAIHGPRMLVATDSISPTGGHGDTNGYKPGLIESGSSICDGIGDCQRAVRQQIKNGADLIKYVATGGVMSNIAAGVDQQFSDEEQRAIVATAHSMGRKVAAHAHGTNGINAALRAGVDSIEHGSYLDDESIELFKESGAYLVPTLSVAEWAVQEAAKPDTQFPPSVVAKASVVGVQTIKGLSQAYQAGVKIALGTDFSGDKHIASKREMSLLKSAGMAEKDILIAATVNGADLLGLSEEIGTLEVDKSADMVAYTENPLENIDTMLDPIFVMARGRIAE